MIAKETNVLLVNGNKFILKTTNINLAKLYNPIEIKVAKAAPSIPKLGIKYIFSETVTSTSPKTKPKTER